MLNKVKVAMTVGIVIRVVAMFFPDLPMPEGAQETIADAIMLGAMWFAFWRTRETGKTVRKLALKRP